MYEYIQYSQSSQPWYASYEKVYGDATQVYFLTIATCNCVLAGSYASVESHYNIII